MSRWISFTEQPWTLKLKNLLIDDYSHKLSSLQLSCAWILDLHDSWCGDFENAPLYSFTAHGKENGKLSLQTLDDDLRAFCLRENDGRVNRERCFQWKQLQLHFQLNVAHI